MGSSTKSLKNKNLSAKPSNPLPTSEELNAYPIKQGAQKTLDKEEEIILKQVPKEEIRMSNEFDDEFGFEENTEEEEKSLALLSDNTAISSLNVAFCAFGQGAGKIASEFLQLGFNRTILFNSTTKDKPASVKDENFVVFPNLDGLGKNVELGRKAIAENASLVENEIRTKLGKFDILFVLAGSGGGTGSSSSVLKETLNRYTEINGGKIVWVVSTPTKVEALNNTIKNNSKVLLEDLKDETFIIIDNERQSTLVKAGISGFYPKANKQFASLLHNFLKLSAEKSDISSCDGEDLRKFFAPKGRIFFGKSLCEPDEKLGNNISRKSVELSFCPSPAKNADCGVLLQVLNEKNANDERVAEHINASVSFVGNMCQTLYQGVYIRNEVDGIGSFIGFSGLKD